jgi:hypothetical protein
MTLVTLYAAVHSGAQEFSVTGDTVAVLAKTVMAEADAHYHIPAAYILPLGEKGTVATITLSGVCEIFSRSLFLWGSDGRPYPKIVTGITFTWHPPSQHPELEPPADERTRMPILAQYTQFAGEGLVRLAEADANLTIPFSWTQENKEKLSTAQLIVAMATLISKRLDGILNLTDAYTIARIYAPTNWEDINNPYSLLPATPQFTPMTLRVWINGVQAPTGTKAANDQGPFPQPFCDTMSIHIDASGPIKQVTLQLDGKLLTTFDGAGAFGKSIDSLDYEDARHLLIITASPTVASDKPITITLPIFIFNGRAGDFTPAETPTTATEPVGDND